jgi:integrase
MGEISSGGDPQERKKQLTQEAILKNNSTLGGIVEGRYKDWVLVNQRRGSETLSLIRSNFGHWFSKPLSNITVDDIDQWRTEKLKSGLARSTINRRVTALKGVLNKAVSWGVIHENSLAAVSPYSVDDRIVRFLSPDEEHQLLQALENRELTKRKARDSGNQWRKTRGQDHMEEFDTNLFVDYLRPLVILALNTGLRRGELFGLEWQNVHLSDENPRLAVESSTTKTRKLRHVPLNSIAKEALEKWGPSSSQGLVFPNPKTGKKLDNINRSWGNLLRAADISNFRFHDVRHTFASKLVMRNISLYVVQRLLGHSSIEMTQRYSHLAPEFEAQAVEALTS